jgi:ribosome maturation factor RimP
VQTSLSGRAHEWAGEMSGRKPTFYLQQYRGGEIPNMAFDVDQIRATAQRVAASHGLDVVEIEFHGGAKHRILRVFIEKNSEERRHLAAHAAEAGADRLAGVTHGDCEAFSRDFGTVLDVEDLVPGAEYTLEVSSPGLDRKLHGLDDYRRFTGMLAKVQTFAPVAGNRHWQGRLTEVSEQFIRLDVSASRRKNSSERRAQSAAGTLQHIEVALNNIEKAQLVPEF